MPSGPSARTKPAASSPVRISSQGSPSGTGRSKVTTARAPWFAASRLAAALAGVSRATVRPHVRQCGTPTLAKSSFR